MAWRPRQLTRAQLEERRLAAARLLRAGHLSQAAIARELGVSRASVTRWRQRLALQGLRGLRRRPPPGRPSRLTVAQWQQLLRLLQRGPLAAGFATARWTLPRVATLIARRFGVRYHARSLGRALRARGWSPQQPRSQAAERDEAAITAWRQRDWPRIKRGRAAAGVPSPL